MVNDSSGPYNADTMIDRIRHLLSVMALAVLGGTCACGETFSFAVIADPHLNGNPDHTARLKMAIDWIIGNKNAEGIELAFVVGDIAWKGNLKLAKGMLDRLDNMGVVYIPIVGDNEVQCGSEKEFTRTFNAHYRRLSRTLPGWKKAPTPVNGMYLHNFSFDYKGCHFVCCDFNSREHGNEGGELHDFAGGSWPWFKKDIQACSKTRKESIVVFTHIGMFRTGFGKADEFLFSKGEMKKIKSFLWDYRDYVDSNYAGHIHQNWHASVWSGLFTTLYHVRSTDETWFCRQWPEGEDRSVTVRLVEVNSGGRKVSYRQHVIDAQKP